MPRAKKQHLKRRKDGRFRCVYNGIPFYGTTEDEAFAKRKEYQRLEAQESFIREKPKVSEYAERWLPIVKAGVRNKTYNENVAHMNHLISEVGDMYIKDVRPSDIKRVYSAHYANASDSYIKHAHSLFINFFGSAHDDGLIRSNPAKADAAKPHKGKTGSHRNITPEERELIETVATDHPMHIAAIIMLYAGLRPQEVKALRMEDIDIENRVIHVRSFVHVSGNRYEESSEGKTRLAARTVPLFPPVIEAIKGKTGLILSKNGKVATPCAWQKSWKSYCHKMEFHMNGILHRWYGKTKEHQAILAEKKELSPWKSFTVTPYDLRHSFVAWARDNGAELNTVVKWMGHTNANMVLHIYDEVTSDRAKNEAEKLFSTFAKVQTEGQK